MIRMSTTARGLCVLAAAGLAAGCGAAAPGRPAPAGPPGWRQIPAGSQVRVPVPDYASPASVAAAFYVAWGSVDAAADQPGTSAARCAPLVTPALERQLSGGQPATAAWAQMRREHLVSLVSVRAVTVPDGAPAPGPGVVYLRVYATRVTTAAGVRTASADGTTVELAESGRRWLVSAVLFW